jgi:hypothetical protein
MERYQLYALTIFCMKSLVSALRLIKRSELARKLDIVKLLADGGHGDNNGFGGGEKLEIFFAVFLKKIASGKAVAVGGNKLKAMTVVGVTGQFYIFPDFTLDFGGRIVSVK